MRPGLGKQCVFVCNIHYGIQVPNAAKRQILSKSSRWLRIRCWILCSPGRKTRFAPDGKKQPDKDFSQHCRPTPAGVHEERRYNSDPCAVSHENRVAKETVADLCLFHCQPECITPASLIAEPRPARFALREGARISPWTNHPTPPGAMLAKSQGCDFEANRGGIVSATDRSPAACLNTLLPRAPPLRLPDGEAVTGIVKPLPLTLKLVPIRLHLGLVRLP